MHRVFSLACLAVPVGGGVRIHPENARMSGRHGVQYVAQCVACAALGREGAPGVREETEAKAWARRKSRWFQKQLFSTQNSSKVPLPAEF